MKKTPEEKIYSGIQKYQYLRNALQATDVSTDEDFQRAFNGFFRMRQRSQSYYDDFYCYLERHKAIGVVFEDVLAYLYEKHGKIEMSFSSKMVALVNPNLPIWDSIVAEKHFGLKKPSTYCKNRFEKCVEKYAAYCDQYAVYMQSEDAQQKIAKFNRLFPGTDISDVKKVDFILWQDR